MNAWQRLTGVLAHWQSTGSSVVTLLCGPVIQCCGSPHYRLKVPCLVRQLVHVTQEVRRGATRLKYASPLRNDGCFWQPTTPANMLSLIGPVFSSTPLRAFIGRALLTTTGSSATSHPQPPRVTSCAAASGTRPELMPGFPSYCTGSLLDMPPSSTALV